MAEEEALSSRILRSSSCSHRRVLPSPAPADLKNQHRPANYKSYDSSGVLKALEAVHQGMSIREAAARFGVPKSTLGDRASGRVIRQWASKVSHHSRGK